MLKSKNFKLSEENMGKYEVVKDSFKKTQQAQTIKEKQIWIHLTSLKHKISMHSDSINRVNSGAWRIILKWWKCLKLIYDEGCITMNLLKICWIVHSKWANDICQLSLNKFMPLKKLKDSISKGNNTWQIGRRLRLSIQNMKEHSSKNQQENLKKNGWSLF